MFILKAKSFNHIFISHQAIGEAITIAIKTSFTKSFERSAATLETEAPSTFRTPISFVCCETATIVKPNNPRQEIKMRSMENITDKLVNCRSVLYCLSNSSSTNEYSKGWLGSTCFQAASRDCMVVLIFCGGILTEILLNENHSG